MNKETKKLYTWLLSKPGYLKCSVEKILDKYPITVDVWSALKALKEARKTLKNNIRIAKPKIQNPIIYSETKIKDIPSSYFGARGNQSRVNLDKANVLVIGDTHFPFEKEGYLDHCLDMQKKYRAGTILHIGDVADNCYSSFHDNNPDGMGAADELEQAIKSLKAWYKAFPHVKVTLGNHCQIIQRKAFASGLSKKWIKGLAEVLEVPNWEFEIDFDINNVLYTHGTGTSGDKAAFNKALNRRKSVVQGHLHSQASIMWNTSNIDKIFAMQVGCGVDESKYAFDYAKNFSKKFIISCGLVLENGTLPILELMKL
jgi:predicted phosphodiesterase